MTESSPSRRAIVRGAAWTVPAIAIAVAAPAASASGGTVAEISVLSPSEQTYDYVVLAVQLLDAAGQPVAGAVRATLAPNAVATFIDSGSLSYFTEVDESGFVALGIYATEPGSTLAITLQSGSVSTGTTIELTA